MPAGIGVGQLLGLVRDTRARAQGRGFVSVLGPGASQLAQQLSEGGDATAVRIGASGEALALVVLVEQEPGRAEMEAMRRSARAGVAIVAVRSGSPPALPVPYVLPEDVVEVSGLPGPVEPIVRALVAALGDEAAALAGRVPRLREETRRHEVSRTAFASAALAAAPFVPQARMPLLTLAQGAMLLRLELVEGKPLPQDPAGVARVSAPALGAAVAAGFVFRGLYRRLPRRGALPGAAIAYAGTRLLGELRARV